MENLYSRHGMPNRESLMRDILDMPSRLSSDSRYSITSSVRSPPAFPVPGPSYFGNESRSRYLYEPSWNVRNDEDTRYDHRRFLIGSSSSRDHISEIDTTRNRRDYVPEMVSSGRVVDYRHSREYRNDRNWNDDIHSTDILSSSAKLLNDAQRQLSPKREMESLQKFSYVRASQEEERNRGSSSQLPKLDPSDPLYLLLKNGNSGESSANIKKESPWEELAFLKALQIASNPQKKAPSQTVTEALHNYDMKLIIEKVICELDKLDKSSSVDASKASQYEVSSSVSPSRQRTQNHRCKSPELANIKINERTFSKSPKQQRFRTSRSKSPENQKHKRTFSRSPIQYRYRTSRSKSPKRYRSRSPDDLRTRSSRDWLPRSRSRSPRRRSRNDVPNDRDCRSFYGRYRSPSPRRARSPSYSPIPFHSHPLEKKSSRKVLGSYSPEQFIGALQLVTTAIKYSKTPYVVTLTQDDVPVNLSHMPPHLKRMLFSQRFELNLNVTSFVKRQNWSAFMQHLITFALEHDLNHDVYVEARAHDDELDIRYAKPFEVAEYIRDTTAIIAFMSPEARAEMEETTKKKKKKKKKMQPAVLETHSQGSEALVSRQRYLPYADRPRGGTGTDREADYIVSTASSSSRNIFERLGEKVQCDDVLEQRRMQRSFRDRLERKENSPVEVIELD